MLPFVVERGTRHSRHLRARVELYRDTSRFQEELGTAVGLLFHVGTTECEVAGLTREGELPAADDGLGAGPLYLIAGGQTDRVALLKRLGITIDSI